MRLFHRHARRVSRANSRVSCCPVIAGSAVVYCVTCDTPLGSRCVIEGAHRDHQLKDLKDAVQEQVRNLCKLSKTLKDEVNKYGDLTPRIEAAERELEEKCNRTQELLQSEYNSLMSLIDQNREQAFFILAAQKEMIKRQLHQLMEDSHNYQTKTIAMIDEVEKFSTRQETENPASMLGEISALETSMHAMNKFYSSVDKNLQVDDTRLIALEHSIQKIVEKNKELLPRPWEFSETITLDERSTHANIHISDDKMEMSVSPLGPKRTSNSVAWRTSRATQRFSDKAHYWEVAVGGCESWMVGVVENRSKDVQAKAARQEQRDTWILECDGGVLSALHNNEFIRVKESNIETLGVFLDCDKGRLKFYNVNTGDIIYTFIARFKHAVSPTFSIQAQSDSMARLKICNLIHKCERRFELPTPSVPSESNQSPVEEAMELSSDSSV